MNSASEKQKPSCPFGQGRLRPCKNYCFFSFAGSCAPALDEDEELGELPLAALELGVEELGAEELGVELELLELDAPPAADESFFGASADEDELEDDGELGVVTVADPDAEPDGVLGVVVVEPEDDDAPEPGVVVREVARSPALSQPVSIPAPSARETATARAESLIARGLRGWGKANGARIRPDAVPS